MSARHAQPPESEPTEIGEQVLVTGVRPVTLRDRLAVRQAEPPKPKRNPEARQKPCDLGLFDELGRAQTDLVDMLRAERAAAGPDGPP